MNQRKRLFLIILATVSFINGQAQHQVENVLAPGDQVKIIFPMIPIFNQTSTIQKDGTVSLTIGGPTHLAGRTVAEAIQIVQQQASRRLKDPVANVEIVDAEQPYFVVAGEVPNPRSYLLRGPTSALQAIMLAGGVKSSGKEAQVAVLHQESNGAVTVRVINLKHPARLKVKEMPFLASGDMIYVSRTALSHLTDYALIASTFGLYLNAVGYIVAR